MADKERSKGRHRIRNIVLLVLGGLALLLFLARVGWELHARSVLQKEIDAIKAKGEPIEWEEIASEGYELDNAVSLYMAAQREIGEVFWRRSDSSDNQPGRVSRSARDADSDELFSIQDEYYYLLEDPALRQAHRAEVVEFLDELEPALTLARSARRFETVVWRPFPYLNRYGGVDHPDVGGSESLGRLLCLASLMAHEKGEEVASLEYLRDARALGDSFAGTLGGWPHSSQCKVSDEVSLAIEQISPNLLKGPIKESSRELVRTVTAELLDREPMQKGLVAAFLGDRVVFACQSRAYIYENIRGHGLIRRAHVFALRPLLIYEEAALLRTWTRSIAAARTGSYARVNAVETERSNINWPITVPALPTFSPDMELTTHFRSLALRRMAGVALSLRMYEIDNGRRPKTLEELVGKYLRKVPDDPFTDPPRPIQYLLEAEQPLLYCVGENETDDGGSFELSEYGGRVKSDSNDIVFFLNGDRPVPRRDKRGPW